jgi:hypothetical protein
MKAALAPPKHAVDNPLLPLQHYPLHQQQQKLYLQHLKQQFLLLLLLLLWVVHLNKHDATIQCICQPLGSCQARPRHMQQQQVQET